VIIARLPGASGGGGRFHFRRGGPARSRLRPEVKPYLIATHLSVEAGHTAICKKLALEPLLDLRMRLGRQRSGAGFPDHRGRRRILDEMATFEEAGVAAMIDACLPRLVF
jgi:NaMN:DMB phosphoribosyltransferase